MKKLIVAVIALGAVGFVGWRVYTEYRARAAGPDPAAAAAKAAGRGGRGGGSMQVPLVDTAVATEGRIESRVSLIGSMRPIAEVQVMSKIAGRVEKVLVDVGDAVKTGQLIAAVEDREIQQQIGEAEASLAIARASIRGDEAELQNLTNQVRRYRELHEQNLISRQDLEDLVTRQRSAEAKLELSRAQLRQADARLNQDKINLENTRVYSPLDGFVGKRHVHPGALIGINTPILNLVDLRTMRMVINVVERDIVRVTRGVTAQVSVDAFPGKTFPGKVLRVSPVLDPATRTGEVEIHVLNPGLDLRAEMFGRVTLDLGTQHTGVIVPREAVVYRGDTSGVFVLNGTVAKFRPIEAGLMQQNVIEVIKGVTIGERVVTMGASLLKDGDQVRLRGEGGGGKRPQGERPAGGPAAQGSTQP